jgi:Domain of unknown function (DUF4136)
MGEMQRWRVSVASVVPVALVGLFGCHPENLNDASETDTVITARAHGYDYSTTKTYDLPDTVADLCEAVNTAGDAGEAGAGNRPPIGTIDCESPTHSYDTLILNTVRQNLEARGYVQVSEGSTPDVVMLVGTIASNNWVVYQSYPWGWYYPGYYGWSGYYPYYPYTTAVNYMTGTVVMDLVSLKDADLTTLKAPSIWYGAINGLLQTGAVATTTRITTNIDQAFAQSEYLEAGSGQ